MGVSFHLQLIAAANTRRSLVGSTLVFWLVSFRRLICYSGATKNLGKGSDQLEDVERYSEGFYDAKNVRPWCLMACWYACGFKFVNRSFAVNELKRKSGSLGWVLWQGHKTSYQTRCFCMGLFTESEMLCRGVHLNIHTGSVKCNEVCIVIVRSVAFNVPTVWLHTRLPTPLPNPILRIDLFSPGFKTVIIHEFFFFFLQSVSCYITSPSYLPWLDRHTNFVWRLHTMKVVNTGIYCT